MVTGSDEVYFQVPVLYELTREVDELTGGALSEVGYPLALTLPVSRKSGCR